MKALAPVSFIFAVVAWALIVVMGINLLSAHAGPERACDTACIQIFFFSSIGVAVLSVIMSLVSITRAGVNALNVLAFLAALAICSIASFLFIAGNFF
jgi:hypothetical protein